MSLRIDVLEIALNSLDDTDYPLDYKVEEVLEIINGNSNARSELVNELASEAVESCTSNKSYEGIQVLLMNALLIEAKLALLENSGLKEENQERKTPHLPPPALKNAATALCQLVISSASSSTIGSLETAQKLLFKSTSFLETQLTNYYYDHDHHNLSLLLDQTFLAVCRDSTTHNLNIFIPGLVYATHINSTVTTMSARKIFKATSEHFRQDVMHILANNLFALIDDSSNIDDKNELLSLSTPLFDDLTQKEFNEIILHPPLKNLINNLRSCSETYQVCAMSTIHSFLKILIKCEKGYFLEKHLVKDIIRADAETGTIKELIEIATKQLCNINNGSARELACNLLHVLAKSHPAKGSGVISEQIVITLMIEKGEKEKKESTFELLEKNAYQCLHGVANIFLDWFRHHINDIDDTHYSASNNAEFTKKVAHQTVVPALENAIQQDKDGVVRTALEKWTEVLENLQKYDDTHKTTPSETIAPSKASSFGAEHSGSPFVEPSDLGMPIATENLTPVSSKSITQKFDDTHKKNPSETIAPAKTSSFGAEHSGSPLIASSDVDVSIATEKLTPAFSTLINTDSVNCASTATKPGVYTVSNEPEDPRVTAKQKGHAGHHDNAIGAVEVLKIDARILGKQRGAQCVPSSTTVFSGASSSNLEDAIAAKQRGEETSNIDTASSREGGSDQHSLINQGRVEVISRLDDRIAAKTNANALQINTDNTIGSSSLQFSENSENLKPNSVTKILELDQSKELRPVNDCDTLKQPLVVTTIINDRQVSEQHKETNDILEASVTTDECKHLIPKKVDNKKDDSKNYYDDGVQEGDLAVAVAVSPEDEELLPDLQEAVEYDKDSKPPIYRNKTVRKWTAIVIIFAIALSITLGVFISRTFSKTNELINTERTLNLTESPTSSPTSAPTTDMMLPVKEQLFRIFGNQGEKNVAYNKALKWISDDNLTSKLIESLSKGEVNGIVDLKQRFAASWFYFSMSGDEWLECPSPSTSNFSDTSEDSFLCEYTDLYGKLIKEKYKWLSPHSECSWRGVSCNDQTVISALELNQVGLKGSIPFVLTHFDDLEFIHMANNKISGSIPHYLGYMNKLRLIDFKDNSITGKIPLDIYSLTNLEELSLSFNAIEGTIDPAISKLVKLLGLHLNENMISGQLPHELGKLTRISHLSLSNNKFNNTLPSSMNQMNKLVKVLLYLNSFSGSLVLPSEASNLEYLDVRNNNFSGALPPSFYNLTGLKIFYAQNNLFSGVLEPAISNLKNLTQIMLRANRFSGKIPVGVSELKRLSEFPEEICDLISGGGDLIQIYADCKNDYGGLPEVNCTCCTDCCNPGDQGSCESID